MFDFTIQYKYLSIHYNMRKDQKYWHGNFTTGFHWFLICRYGYDKYLKNQEVYACN